MAEKVMRWWTGTYGSDSFASWNFYVYRVVRAQVQPHYSVAFGSSLYHSLESADCMIEHRDGGGKRRTIDGGGPSLSLTGP